MNDKRNKFKETLILGESDGKGGFRAKSPQEQMIAQAKAMQEHLVKHFPKMLELRQIATTNIANLCGIDPQTMRMVSQKRDHGYNSSVFQEDCQLMNHMYQVSSKEITVPTASELNKFRCTLIDEVSEVDEIVVRCQEYEDLVDKNTPHAVELKVEILTAFLDWIVDIQVFAMSQCLRYGLNPVPSMQIVMDSNFTKLGEDGQPIFDENKKFLKGPNYKKPEPAIRELVIDALRVQKEMNNEGVN